MKEVREHKPGRASAYDSDLGAHSFGHRTVYCSLSRLSRGS
jgi:hypothetical protein